jgi:hypothetical protein
MQIVDNLFVIQNLTARTTQLWDLKLPEYYIPLIPEHPDNASASALSTNYLHGSP